VWLGILALGIIATYSLRLATRTRHTSDPQEIVLREAADRELAEYLHVRDEVDQQYDAAVEAEGSNPQKMLEINKKFEPLRAKVQEKEEQYDRAWRKAQGQ